MHPLDRPPHLISPDEVAAWLLDSVNRRVTFHNTTFEGADDIRQRGAIINRSHIGAFCQGFYSSSEPEYFYGPA